MGSLLEVEVSLPQPLNLTLTQRFLALTRNKTLIADLLPRQAHTKAAAAKALDSATSPGGGRGSVPSSSPYVVRNMCGEPLVLCFARGELWLLKSVVLEHGQELALDLRDVLRQHKGSQGTQAPLPLLGANKGDSMWALHTMSVSLHFKQQAFHRSGTLLNHSTMMGRDGGADCVCCVCVACGSAVWLPLDVVGDYDVALTPAQPHDCPIPTPQLTAQVHMQDEGAKVIHTLLLTLSYHTGLAANWSLCVCVLCQVVTLRGRVCVHNHSGQPCHLLLALPRAARQQAYHGPAPFYSEECVLQPHEVK